MHGYEIGGGLRVKIGSEEVTVTTDDLQTDKFHQAMIDEEVITVYGTKNTTSFRGKNLIGVQVSNG
jgi:hypothetical protein